MVAVPWGDITLIGEHSPKASLGGGTEGRGSYQGQQLPLNVIPVHRANDRGAWATFPNKVQTAETYRESVLNATSQTNTPSSLCSSLIRGQRAVRGVRQTQWIIIRTPFKLDFHSAPRRTKWCKLCAPCQGGRACMAASWTRWNIKP